MVLLMIIVTLVASFLLTGLAVWLICWAVGLVGITITFSWLLVFVVWFVVGLLKMLFGSSKS